MKKQLLNEGEIRKFMKFANIGTLTDGFVGKINESAALEEDTLEEAEDALEEVYNEEEGADEGMPAEGEHEGEPEMDAEPEMGDEPEMDAEPEMDDEEEVEVDVDMDEVGALEKAIEVLQQVVDAAKGGADMDDEPMGMDDEPMGDEPEMGDDLDEALAALEEVETLDEEEVIEEVTRRVAKRLLAARR
jgi:pilus assembly protein FimV